MGNDHHLDLVEDDSAATPVAGDPTSHVINGGPGRLEDPDERGRDVEPLLVDHAALAAGHVPLLVEVVDYGDRVELAAFDLVLGNLADAA